MSAVLSIGFGAKLYCYNLDIKVKVPRMSQCSLVHKPINSTSFAFPLVSDKHPGPKAYPKRLSYICSLICRQQIEVLGAFNTDTKILIASLYRNGRIW